MKSERKLRILLVADSFGHSTGYYVVAQGLREEGIEVILGGYQIPQSLVEMAIQEDVNCIGYRIMDGAPDILVPTLMKELQDKGALDIKVVVGGIVPKHMIPKLKELGVKEIFPPGSKIRDIAEFIKSLV